MHSEFNKDFKRKSVSDYKTSKLTLSEYCASINVSRKTFYKWLDKYGKPKDYVRLDASKRREMIRRAEKGESVTKICNQYGVSRFVFYKWKARYEKDKVISSLYDNNRKGDDHYRAIDPVHKSRVLEIVRQNPNWSIHQIHRSLPLDGDKPIIGYFGLQRLLEREGLNRYESRLIWSGSQQADVPIMVPQQETRGAGLTQKKRRLLLSPFSIVPKIPGVITQSYITFFLFLIFSFLLYQWTNIIISAPEGKHVGVIFASIALFFGVIFFFYSLKYYLSLLLTLRAGNAREVSKETKETKANFQFSIFNFQFNPFSPFNFLKTIIPRSKRLINVDEVETVLTDYPFVSIQIPFYNEKRVVERSILAATFMQYQSDKYEVIICDDSTDETTQIAKRLLSIDNRLLTRVKRDDQMEVYVSTKAGSPTIKLLHRFTRSGFKGRALHEALKITDQRSKYVSVCDADFIPFPDTLTKFVKYFQLADSDARLAAVQGYQWHVLNKSENWVTRGVRTEYAGSYVVERSAIQLYSGLKQIAGSVYMIKKDILANVGWGESITEDFELTLKLYAQGYKVAYTPYIQAPSECVSTLKRLIRQRMRWAEGHTFNIKQYLLPLLFGTKTDNIGDLQSSSSNFQFPISNLQSNLNESETANLKFNENLKLKIKNSPLSFSERVELVFLSPYYLQAFFFLVGTLAWFISETILQTRLPFWTATLGWSLVFTNIISLPLVNIIGLFLEESEEKDYLGIASFIALSYIVTPFQAYAAVKGLLETKEGPWFRTPKTGRITDTIGKARRGWRFRLPFLGKPLGANALEGKPVLGTTNAAYQPVEVATFANGKRVRNGFIQRMAGNLALSILVVIPVVLPILTPLINSSNTYASPPTLKTVDQREEEAQEEEILPDLDNPGKEPATQPNIQPDGRQNIREQTSGSFDPKNPVNKEEIVRNAFGEEITTPRLIKKTSLSGQDIEL